MHRHLKTAAVATVVCAAMILPAQAGSLVGDGTMRGAVSGTQGSAGATTSSATGATVDTTRNSHAARHIRYRPNATAHMASDTGISADGDSGHASVNSSTEAEGDAH